MMDVDRQNIPEATAQVVAVQENLVKIESTGGEGACPLMKNEVVLICPSPPPGEPRGAQERLKAEVLRVEGHTAIVQVFEDTRGVAVGDPVIQTNSQLSVTLGPGLLGQLYDGLQNPLESLIVQGVRCVAVGRHALSHPVDAPCETTGFNGLQ